MGKFATSLLAIVFQLYAFSSVRADEQVRQVQEALRQRHLFYGNSTGEMSPALSAAIARYQEKKGLLRTGSVDVETCASLGIVGPIPAVAGTPYVLGNNGEVRGANGESLPDASPWPADKDPVRVALSGISPHAFGSSQAAPDYDVKPIPVSRPKAALPRARAASPSQKKTNPFFLAYRSIDHAMKSVFGDKDSKKKRTSRKQL